MELRDHKAEVVSEEDAKRYLEVISAKEPCNEILPAAESFGALYLGNFKALLEGNLQKYHITHAVQTAGQLEEFFLGWGDKLKQLEANGDVHVLRMGWLDGRQEVSVDEPWDGFTRPVAWIHEHRSAGNNLVVNCAQGVSRSATVTVAYLMTINSWSVDEALAFVRTKRSIANPNPHFMAQLAEFRASPQFDTLQVKLGIQ